MANKRVVAKLLDDAKDVYVALKMKVGTERAKGVTSSISQTLLKSINDKISMLKLNCDGGIHIPKNRIAGKYSINYGVTNLWKVNLSGNWRMVYTLNRPQGSWQGDETMVIWLDVLDILSHEEYNRIFDYEGH